MSRRTVNLLPETSAVPANAAADYAAECDARGTAVDYDAAVAWLVDAGYNGIAARCAAAALVLPEVFDQPETDPYGLQAAMEQRP